MCKIIEEPKVHTLTIKKDERGWFAEVLKPKDITNKYFGQISITTPKPNQTKGNHYHLKRIEWFTVLSGRVEFPLYHIKTKKKKKFILGKNLLQTLCIPPLWCHSIKNLGQEDAIILLYYSQPFDKSSPDTYLPEEKKDHLVLKAENKI